MTFLGIVLGVAILLVLIDFYSGRRKDNTDGKKGKSGLRVYVDNATGVNYVKSSPFEQLVIRVDKDGRPYVEGDE